LAIRKYTQEFPWKHKNKESHLL